MRMRFHCELPGGTPWVSVGEIPRLLAQAIHPVAPNDERLGPQARQLAAEEKHTDELRRSILAGDLPTYDPNALVRFDPEHGAMPGALVFVNQLKEYAARFLVEVTVQPDPRQVDESQRVAALDAERRRSGRYQLEEAAQVLADNTGNPLASVLRELLSATTSGRLPVYRPGETLACGYGPTGLLRAREDYEEVYGSDLNEWLSSYATQIVFRFLDPSALSIASPTAPTSQPIPPVAPQARRKRGDTLSPILRDAIELKSYETAPVWQLLTEWAAQSLPPLRKFENGMLFYTNSDGVEQSVSRRNISDRLRRARRGHTPRRIGKSVSKTARKKTPKKK